MIAALLTGAGLSVLTNVLESVFGVIKAYQRRKMMVLEHSQTLELARVNAEIRHAEAESERETTMLEMEGSAFNASYQHAIAGASGSYKWAATVISLVRPVLTFALLYVAYELVQSSEDPTLEASASLALIELAATATSWWFGDRSFKRARNVST